MTFASALPTATATATATAKTGKSKWKKWQCTTTNNSK